MILGLAASKTGWIYAAMFQRDQPITPFQKTVWRYFGWFTLGMAYIVLWQYELGSALRSPSAWRWLLGLWTILTFSLCMREHPSAAGKRKGNRVSGFPETIMET